MADAPYVQYQQRERIYDSTYLQAGLPVIHAYECRCTNIIRLFTADGSDHHVKSEACVVT